MESRVKTIGILTSGGDSPGMNVAIRAVCRSALTAGIRVMGIRRGYQGLITGDIFEMSLRSVSEIIHKGGTCLYTARCSEFREKAGVQKAVDVCREFGIDGIVVIGGDGSFRGAADLSAMGVACIGIPGTIDNDIGASDYTIGYDTALNTIIDMVDRIRDTSQSHERCTVVEVMGRNAGWLALEGGVAVGAAIILVPEIPYDFEKDVVNKIKATLATGKKHFIIVVAEGIEGKETFQQRIYEATGIETRYSVLGYVQRGGSPTARDRIIGSRMGCYAVELLKKGIGNRVVVLKNDTVTDFDIQEALKIKKPFDKELYEWSNKISI